MKTHFAKIRRYTVYVRIIAPILLFAAFLLYAKFGLWAASYPLVLALLALMMFPTERINMDDNLPTSILINTLIRISAIFPFALWMADMPWFESFLDSIFSGNLLWDWRLIVAVFFWCIGSSYNMVHKALKLKDSDIISIYESRSSNKPESEQAAPRNR